AIHAALAPEATGTVSRPEPPILRCKGLTKRFGGLVAVDSVSFEVQQGTIFALIGPNGAGKSTLFNLISGTARPDAGAVYLAGEPVTGLKPHQIAERGVARTFQLIRLFPSVTVVENVLVGADLHGSSNLLDITLGLPDARAADQRALEVALAA